MVGERLRAGDVVVDATAGNGHDTEFLARSVGDLGKVYAFDVQAAALEATRDRLERGGIFERVRLVDSDHAEMGERVTEEDRGAVGAVMFNLGYLPGGDKGLVTEPESTLEALGAALALIRAGGVVTVVVYTGHPGGEAEARAVEAMVTDGMPSGISAVRYVPLGRTNAPYLIAFTRSADR